MAFRLAMIVAAAATLAAAGCVSTLPAPAAKTLGRADIVNSSPALPLPADTPRARYSFETKACSAGSVQLLPSDEVKALTAGWEPPATGCEGPGKLRLPGYGDYPLSFQRTQQSGSAQVLVRLTADGEVESARAVCATAPSFGQAAEATVAKIGFSPMRCAGTPTRIAFLLPLDYTFP
ncbi:energy transducer TonB [Lysobacter sp. GCM10012299]|uniref:energy transducer TonB n=1 Tax=Lysobacter sp. GCM10012299 TaxID=3317333 RepID=UPI00361FC0DA